MLRSVKTELMVDLLLSPLPPSSTTLYRAESVTRHRAVCERDSTTHQALENAQSSLWYCSHHIRAENWENRVKEEGASPTSGLELWPTKGGGIEESWSHTHGPDPCIALEHHKNTDAPRGLDGIRKSLSLCLPLFSLLKNKRGSCIMASDQMTAAEVNISLTFVLCVTRLMFLHFVHNSIPSLPWLSASIMLSHW